MILNDKDAAMRLSSPMNLINQLSSRSQGRASAMGLFGIGKKLEDKPLEIKEAELSTPSIEPATMAPETPKQSAQPSFNPFTKSLIPAPSNIVPQEQAKPEEPSLDSLLSDSESQIKLAHTHDSALKLLHNAVDILATKLDDIKADKLPAVISAASKTVESIRRERLESAKNGKDKEVHYHFYTPIQKKVSDYEITEVA